MSLRKESLSTISGLAYADFIEALTDNQFAEYCKVLYIFIESFPVQEQKLKTAFSAKDYNAFSQTLSGVREVLEKIHAPGLEQSCRRLITELNTQKYNIVEAHLTYLLAEISALSIDIQMAQSEPVAAAAAAAADTPAADTPGQNADRQKLILGVDDVAMLLMGLKSILSNTEYKFTGVNSGAAALKYVEKYSPDLFILDIEMPRMNGYELATRLKELGHTAPVIFLTGNASKDYVRKAIEVGAADFIVKPVNKEQVLDKICKHIR